MLTKEGFIITCMVDCEEHIVYLENIAEQSKGCFRVCLDIDMSSRFFQFHFGVQGYSKKCAGCVESSRKGEKVIIFNVRWCNGI